MFLKSFTKTILKMGDYASRRIFKYLEEALDIVFRSMRRSDDLSTWFFLLDIINNHEKNCNNYAAEAASLLNIIESNKDIDGGKINFATCVRDLILGRLMIADDAHIVIINTRLYVVYLIHYITKSNYGCDHLPGLVKFYNSLSLSNDQ